MVSTRRYHFSDLHREERSVHRHAVHVYDYVAVRSNKLVDVEWKLSLAPPSRANLILRFLSLASQMLS